jgi:hypothetical protein
MAVGLLTVQTKLICLFNASFQLRVLQAHGKIGRLRMTQSGRKFLYRFYIIFFIFENTEDTAIKGKVKVPLHTMEV